MCEKAGCRFLGAHELLAFDDAKSVLTMQITLAEGSKTVPTAWQVIVVSRKVESLGFTILGMSQPLIYHYCFILINAFNNLNQNTYVVF